MKLNKTKVIEIITILLLLLILLIDLSYITLHYHDKYIADKAYKLQSSSEYTVLYNNEFRDTSKYRIPCYNVRIYDVQIDENLHIIKINTRDYDIYFASCLLLLVITISYSVYLFFYLKNKLKENKNVLSIKNNVVRFNNTKH